MEISGSLSDTTRVLTNGWVRRGNSEPLESTVGERELEKHVQGPAGPDGPVSQTLEQTKTKQMEKRVQKSAEPKRIARTFRVYSRNYFLINAVNRYHAIFSRHV